MTATLDILSDSFPHGTPDGHRLGCRTTHCPSPIACRVVAVRYAGDHRFRTRFVSGWSAADIAAADVAEAAAAKEAARAARRKPKPVKVKSPRGTRVSPSPWTIADLQTLRERHAAGDVDPEIAAVLGVSEERVKYQRRELGLKGNRKLSASKHGTYARYAAGCQNASTCPATPTCHDEAKRYWRLNAANKRRRDGVPEKEVAA
jgi:hypothetical protein